MFVLFDHNLNALLPEAKVTVPFNRIWYGEQDGGDFDFGMGCESAFKCLQCGRYVPSGFAEADHIFPDKYLKAIFDGANDNRFKAIAGLAAIQNANPMTGPDPFGTVLGTTSLHLPDYSELNYFCLRSYQSIQDFYEEYARTGASFESNFTTVDLKNVTGSRVKVENDNYTRELTYQYLSRHDHSNICMICACCNRAKSRNPYPAHKSFIDRIEVNIGGINWGGIIRYMPTNEGETYNVEPVGDCSNQSCAFSCDYGPS